MKVFQRLPKIHSRLLIIPLVFITLVSVLLTIFLAYFAVNQERQLMNFLSSQRASDRNFSSIKTELTSLKNQDQYKRNEALQKEIDNIKKTYQKSLSTYERLMDLKDSGKNTVKLNSQYAAVLKSLSEQNYTAAEGTLNELNKQLEALATPLTAAPSAPSTANVPTDNTPPSSGYKRQTVQVDGGSFLVDIVSADLNSTKVIVDTASEEDCKDNCPVLPLADYAARSGAYAGINGSFFCPSTYPSCAGKTNSFDTLLMNKNKKYFNSDNNVYSVVPAAIFSQGSARFVSRSLEWGRDTSVDSVIANYPLLLSGGNSQFGGSSDQKITAKGTRCFIGTKGSTVYIGVVHNASTDDEVKVLKALGIQDALGLDQGGSTALWSGGYKVGPGRNIPNAILFVKR